MSGLFGVVLNGGTSRRFGSPKARAELGGLSLLTRALRAVAPAASGGLGVVGSGDGVPAGIPVRGDRRPNLGPLAGLETAFAWAREAGAEGIVVLACDLPLVDGGIMLRLARRWRDSGDPPRAAVMAVGGAERQPLCAVYGVDLADGLERRLDGGGDRSVAGWIGSVAARADVPVPDDALRNVNCPGDLEAAGAAPAPPPAVVSVIGWKDSGKTTVAVRLVAGLRDAGFRVTALKHGHGFELDTPGTDSWRLRHEGGATRVVLAGPEGLAVMGEWGPDGERSLAELVRRFGDGADLVVAEGWKGESVPAVEVRGRGEPAPDRPALCPPDGADVDRFLAVVGEGARGVGEPERLSPDLPDLGKRLAAVVLARLLPDRAGALDLSRARGPR